MFTPRMTIDDIVGDPTILARCVLARELFSLTSRSVRVPTGWAAYVTRTEGGPSLLGPGQSLLAGQGAREVLFVRTTTIECAIEEPRLRSADGFLCHGWLRVGVRILTDPDELDAFRKNLLGPQTVLRIADLEKYLQGPMGGVLNELCGRWPAAELSRSITPAAVDNTIRGHLGPTCLAGGLVIDGPATVRIESPAYQQLCQDQAHLARQQRRLAVQTQLQRAQAAAQREHLDHLARLLDQVQQVAASHEAHDLAGLLQTFSETDRAELYAALWHFHSDQPRTRFAAAVSGYELLFFDPSTIGRPARRIVLPTELGPLRSVQVDEYSLEAGLCLIGAGYGVFLVEIESGRLHGRLLADIDQSRPPRGGANAVAMSSGGVFATHSELGLLYWPLHGPDSAPGRSLMPDLTRGADTVRAVQLDRQCLWFAVDQMLFSLPLDEAEMSAPICYAAGRATISAVAVAADTIYAGNTNGQIIAWDKGDPDSARIVRGPTGAPVESIDVLDTAGLKRLLVADRQNAIIEMIVGDSYTRRYEAGPYIVRRAATAEDLLFAMTDRRDRLLAWNPRQPQRPIADLIVPHLTGEPVQDICLIPDAACESRPPSPGQPGTTPETRLP